MNKMINPIACNGTRDNGNPNGQILINLKILSVSRMNYAAGYKKTGMCYLIRLQDPDNGTCATIFLEEKELRSSRILSHIFEKYEKEVPTYYSYMNAAIGEESIAKQVRKIILDMAKKTQISEIPFYGGWLIPNSFDRLYCRPLNSYLRNLARENYPSFSAIFELPITKQLEQVLCTSKNYFQDLMAHFSCVLDLDVRRFFFLFWHYGYMTTLFDQYQSNHILCVEIADSILRRNVIQYFFGTQQAGSCETETNTTTRQVFINKFSQTKDVPFVLEERIIASKNTLRAKVSDLQNLIADRCADAVASAAPVVFCTGTKDYPGLLHLRLDSHDFSDGIFQSSAFDFYAYFDKLSGFLPKAFWEETLSKNVTYYSRQGKPLLYAIFATLSTVLQDCYAKAGLQLEQMLGINEDIEAFLDRYLPEISTIPVMRTEEFLAAIHSVAENRDVRIYQRLEKENEKCVPQQVLEQEACILVGDDGWALNDVAFKKVLDTIPHAPSRRETLRILDRDGALSEARTNRDSLQNKLRVHTLEGETVIHPFVVLRAELFTVPEEETEEEQLPDHRYFLLGRRADSERPLYWDFDDEKNMNRHMLITGKSGAGKSYLLQKLVRQAATNQITTIIFHNQGDLPDVPNRKIIDIAADKPSVGSSSEMDFYDALKIAALLQQVIRLRNTQANTVRQCYAEYLKRTSQQSLFGFFKSFKEIAKDLELTNYSSVQAKFSEILDSKAFSAKPINWAEYEGATLILDFRGCSDYVNLFQMQAELLLRDLYYYKKRNPSSPLIVIVDEFQKMDTGDNSALAMILREGRKYGWSLWLASQLAESGNGAQLKKLSDQASLQLYFSQGAKGNRSIGNMLGTTTRQKNQIFEELQGLAVGEFLVLQDSKNIRKCVGEA